MKKETIKDKKVNPEIKTNQLISPGMYRHSKSGRLYKVLGIARHSETLEPMVVYQAQYNSPEFGNRAFWIRPLHMFQELVVIGNTKVPRFVPIVDEQ